MPEKSEHNGMSNHFTDEQIKGIATYTLQNDERIERLWDCVEELMLLAIRHGWPVKEAANWLASAPKRAEASGLVKSQRDKLRQLWGLDA
jgi:hypothetical protein